MPEEQDARERFGGFKAEAQKRISQAITILEGAANLLVQAKHVYPDDMFLRKRIDEIVQGEEEGEATGIRIKMDELRETIHTIASLEHVD